MNRETKRMINLLYSFEASLKLSPLTNRALPRTQRSARSSLRYTTPPRTEPFMNHRPVLCRGSCVYYQAVRSYWFNLRTFSQILNEVCYGVLDQGRSVCWVYEKHKADVCHLGLRPTLISIHIWISYFYNLRTHTHQQSKPRSDRQGCGSIDGHLRKTVLRRASGHNHK